MTRVLLTNDDGLEAPGMAALVDVINSLGWAATVVAPEEPMSGSSRSRKGDAELPWRRVSDATVPTFALRGTPAACVVFGLTSGLVEPVDFCLSGVNAGENLGAELSVSGTFGAALEAASFGVPGIALSRQYGGDIGSDPSSWDWSQVVKHAPSAIEWTTQQSKWRVANINLPNSPAINQPVRSRVSDRSYFQNRFSLDENRILSTYADLANLDPRDDIMHFAVENRISVSLFASVHSEL
ncbi:MAG TPA: 5'/3'-nucleotidase SurE [Jatrophihabitans sp.]|nr:5'/3'-nucleotidase SurE [Jatrophihabitans sp.]